MSDYADLDQPRKIHGVGGHILEGIGTGTIYGTVLDIHKRQHLVHFSVYVYLALDGTSCLFRRLRARVSPPSSIEIVREWRQEMQSCP